MTRKDSSFHKNCIAVFTQTKCLLLNTEYSAERRTMNTQKLTQKSLEALAFAQSTAIERSHQQIGQEHLLYALCAQEGGLIPELITKLGKDPAALKDAALERVESLPGVSGPGREPDKIYVSQDADRALTASEKQAEQMKDEYVSVEHLFIGILDTANSGLKELFGRFGIDKNKFLAALSSVRGNTKVTSDNPEETYDVLSKYGQDLVELARRQKLDPVIGRDSEIRNVIRILSRKTKNNPRTYRRTGRGEDCHRRRPGYKDSQGRRSPKPR
jgi:ATP-dependent Clp protease ATP-binding subunit ClpB